MNEKNIEKIISEALAIEREEAYAAGAIGYMARALIQATMPHSKTEGSEFKRKNGFFKLTILADSEIGLPYGSLPRLLISWITTEAVKTKKKEIVLGHTLSKFMSELGLIPSGGRWGTITRLKDQMKRLFSSAISCTYDDGKTFGIRNVLPVEEANLWWDPKNPEQATIWESTLLLGDSFFKEIINNPVPIDMRALKALKKSPMALDIYCWLTYRMSYLKGKTSIPWEALQVQFGADYKDVRQFKRRFLDQLKKVSIIYPNAKLSETSESLVLSPSKPHIQKQVKLFLGDNNKKTTEKPITEQKSDKEIYESYTAYKLDETIKIIENMVDEEERHKLLTSFDEYLKRKNLLDIRSKIIQGTHSKEVKEELFNFISSYWHHLLGSIKSYQEFSENYKN